MTRWSFTEPTSKMEVPSRRFQLLLVGDPANVDKNATLSRAGRAVLVKPIATGEPVDVVAREIGASRPKGFIWLTVPREGGEAGGTGVPARTAARTRFCGSSAAPHRTIAVRAVEPSSDHRSRGDADLDRNEEDCEAPGRARTDCHGRRPQRQGGGGAARPGEACGESAPGP
ncbi:MAG: hypothetical protein F4012_06910 [Gemmatimonadales bacterium]|nr:hypothetical protein [Gemmatimonadales bacterium]MYL06534.1 hypothetical protein [Gemmatimonadales bacterium]